MKDEIKEILDNALEYLEGIDETRNTKILTTNEANILLDYITNLQEELKETADLCSKHFIKIQTLQEELKSANESITWWTNRFNSVERDNERLKKELNALRISEEEWLEETLGGEKD